MKLVKIITVLGIISIVGIVYVILNRNAPGLLNQMTSTNNSNSTLVERSTTGLPDATEQTSVALSDKETYAITASFVKNTLNNKTIRMLAYNGQIPGPLLRAKQGTSATINFKNELDEPTTIHWHGLRLDNASDGVPDVTQPAVQPGGTFTYQLAFPDPGLYWYHPHTREDYEQNLGMYGLIWVEPTDSTALSPVNQTQFLALSDILFQGDDVYPFSKNTINHALMGRFGNQLLINGNTNYALQAQQGEIIRLALVNTANTRVFRFAIPGAKMKLVGGDSGWQARETFVDSIILSPSERAIIDVAFAKPGEYLIKNDTPAGNYTLGTVTVTNQKVDKDYNVEFSKLRTHELTDNGFALAQEYANKPFDKQINLTINGQGMMGSNMRMNHTMGNDSADGIEWEDTMGMMNANFTNKNLAWVIQDAASGQKNEAVRYVFKKGSKIKIRIFNDPNSMHAMQHTIHFHGNRFLILATNGQKNTNLVWKDSALVPKGVSMDILLDASNPGDWMAHCHIAEHLQTSMMINYRVEK